MSFLETVFIGCMVLLVISTIVVIICKLLYCIFLLFHCVFKPCCCQNTPVYYTPMDDFDYFLYDVLYVCNIPLPTFQMCKCKKKSLTKVEPIYDDFHIIVINPHDKLQIATITKTLN